jgi:gamma-glutamyltranspeptidase/glutathione hydrolase
MSFAQAVPGGLSVGVPGAIRLAAEAHRRWGTLPWAQLFAPSIAMARDGIVVSERLERFTGFRAAMLAKDPAAAAVFLGPDGKPWPQGHVLKQPELARTLSEIAAAGPDAFYSGRVAAALETAVAQAPSNAARLTAADLAGYRVRTQPPLCGSYRGNRICTMGPSSAGGIALLQILGQLERFDLRAMGPDNLLTWHLIAESMRLAFADREAWGGDAAFAAIPVAGLISPQYLAARSALIRMDRAMPTVVAGTPPGAPAPAQARLADVPATSHMVAADAAGRVANLTSTIEAPFGSGLLAAGFVLNNELTDFDFEPDRAGQPAVNRVEPGKRPRSSMTPTIVYGPDGQLLAAFGAAGGATIIAQVAKAIIAHLDWQRSVEDSLGTPQIMADRRGLRYEKDTMLERFAAGWKALGHQPVEAATLPLKANAVARAGNEWRGAADPRSEGAAIAVGGKDSR